MTQPLRLSRREQNARMQEAFDRATANEDRSAASDERAGLARDKFDLQKLRDAWEQNYKLSETEKRAAAAADKAASMEKASALKDQQLKLEESRTKLAQDREAAALAKAQHETDQQNLLAEHVKQYYLRRPQIKEGDPDFAEKMLKLRADTHMAFSYDPSVKEDSDNLTKSHKQLLEDKKVQDQIQAAKLRGLRETRAAIGGTTLESTGTGTQTVTTDQLGNTSTSLRTPIAPEPAVIPATVPLSPATNPVNLGGVSITPATTTPAPGLTVTEAPVVQTKSETEIKEYNGKKYEVNHTTKAVREL